jgi:hypothetical protein
MASPDGRFAVIYERLGTKGLLLHNGKLLRELNRCYYHADDEYPVTLFDGLGGRLLLAHCPEDYRRIELEEAETGRALTASAERKPGDFFHSRRQPLRKAAAQRRLGVEFRGALVCFEIALALTDPNHLDRVDDLP